MWLPAHYTFRPSLGLGQWFWCEFYCAIDTVVMVMAVYYLTTAIEISACCLFASSRCFSRCRPTPVAHLQLSSFFQLSDNVAWLFFYYFLIWRWFISLLLKNIKALRKILLQAFCDVWVFGIIFFLPPAKLFFLLGKWKENSYDCHVSLRLLHNNPWKIK